MVLTSHSSAEAESGLLAGSSRWSRSRTPQPLIVLLLTETLSAGHFHFISIQAPDHAKDQITRRLARSHAVKQALENKRKLQQESGDNFRVTTSKDEPRRMVSKRTRTITLATPLFSLSAGTLDPFQTLAVDSSRLQTLLGDCKLLVAENYLRQTYNEYFRQS